MVVNLSWEQSLSRLSLGFATLQKRTFMSGFFFIDILGTSFTILFSSCIQTALCEYKIHQSNQNGTFGMKNSGKEKNDNFIK